MENKRAAKQTEVRHYHSKDYQRSQVMKALKDARRTTQRRGGAWITSEQIVKATGLAHVDAVVAICDLVQYQQVATQLTPDWIRVYAYIGEL